MRKTLGMFFHINHCMMAKIMGRKEEQKELQRLYESLRPKFVAIYGRRRVGKTFLSGITTISA